MPKVMVALPNKLIGGALCSTPQSLARTHCSKMPCSNVTKRRERKTWRMQNEFFHLAKFRNGRARIPEICNVPAQETAKHRAKFGWLPLSDVAAVTLPRRETR